MTKKNTILILAAILVVLLGVTAYFLSKGVAPLNLMYRREITKIETQSTSDEPEDIEKDLLETNLTGMDKELQDIENELNQAY